MFDFFEWLNLRFPMSCDWSWDHEGGLRRGPAQFKLCVDLFDHLQSPLFFQTVRVTACYSPALLRDV